VPWRSLLNNNGKEDRPRRRAPGLANRSGRQRPRGHAVRSAPEADCGLQAPTTRALPTGPRPSTPPAPSLSFSLAPSSLSHSLLHQERRNHALALHCISHFLLHQHVHYSFSTRCTLFVQSITHLIHQVLCTFEGIGVLPHLANVLRERAREPASEFERAPGRASRAPGHTLLWCARSYGAPGRGANGRRCRPCAPRPDREAVAVHLFRVTTPFALPSKEDVDGPRRHARAGSARGPTYRPRTCNMIYI
jgi:hypothetical protein